jgi:threonine synthase
MNYYSISNPAIKADFKEATLYGQAPDGGLFFPEYIPLWEADFINNLDRYNKTEIGFKIMHPYVGNTIPDTRLMKIIEETLDFEFPLKKINEQIHCMELFHGPTLAFKDLGARFLSRCMGYFAKGEKRKTVVLVATSGDTGGAVADAFYQVPGTEVVILYPSGKVSAVQEKQLTGLGGNIHALEVMGDFDDCQRLVKKAFLDEDLKKNILLTSSNSINISRWLSQQIYYVLAYAQWKESEKPGIAVPSGNFGNLCAGLVAKKSGLPVEHFIAACNSNRVFTSYIQAGIFLPAASKKTVSNAMDVGNPSNFARIIELYQGDHAEIQKDINSDSISDAETVAAIQEVYQQHQVQLDPHTAVAYAALKNWLSDKPEKKGIILGTAHPIKFPEVVEKALLAPIDIPGHVLDLLLRTKLSHPIEPDYVTFKKTFQQLVGQ